MKHLRNIWITILVTVILFAACNSGSEQQSDTLGEIELKVTGKEAAQANFKKGLLLLHSFEFDDAEDEFNKAIKIDKDFVMAYWGVAMSHNHPLWDFQAYDKAKAILNNLAPTPAARIEKAKTELEKDLINSVNILYGKGTKVERDSSYAVYFGELYKKYKGNNEVTAFYSLALLGSVPVGRNVKIYEKAAELAKEVLKTNPKHPGALHYLIHAYDDPQHAALAVKTADSYSVVAPSAGHALHMPTHIYLALGMWDKVISSNIDSWKAGEERKVRKQLTNDELNYHAYHWLMYGYLQNKEPEKAKQILDSMMKFTNEVASKRAREYLVYQKATYLVETNDYKNAVCDLTIKQEDMNIVSRAMDYYVNGIKCYKMKDEKKLSQIVSNLTGAILIDEERVGNSTGAVCGVVKSPIPNSLDLQQAQVMLLELNAKLSCLNNDNTSADKFFKKAVDLESGISYAYGPPTIVKPSSEIYGEWLLEVNRPSEALEQFEYSLKTTPGRLLSIQGKEKAIAMVNADK